MAPFLQVLNAEGGVTMQMAATPPAFEAKQEYSRLTWHYTTRNTSRSWKCRTAIVVVKEPFETDVHIEITYVSSDNGFIRSGILVSRRCPERFVLEIAVSVIGMRVGSALRYDTCSQVGYIPEEEERENVDNRSHQRPEAYQRGLFPRRLVKPGVNRSR